MKREVGGTGSAKTGEDEEQETCADKKFFWESGPKTEEVQKCTGQKCTKHQLVLLTILNVLGPKKANNS